MSCPTPFYVKNPRVGQVGQPETLPLPCGRCPDCKRRRVAGWSFRLRMEDKQSEGSHFITLTYDPSVVPISPKGYMTLNPRDLTLFWKRLRKAGVKFKYYAVGEYGTNRARPHYHAIVFLTHAMSVVDFHIQVQKAWDLGTTDVGTVTGASVAYTLKYIDKESRIPMHKNDDRVKEFSRSSNGLGANYLTTNVVDYHKSNLDKNYVLQDGHKIAMPRYYRDRILSDDLKAKQRVFIQAAADEADKKARDYHTNIGSTIPYEVAKAQSLEIDYQRFYQNQKPRDL